MSDRSVCSVCWCATAYVSKDCDCECHKENKMSNGRYIKPSTDKEYVWIVWILQNLELEGRRELHSVHKTKKSAFRSEGLLPRNEFQYYSIETKELIDE